MTARTSFYASLLTGVASIVASTGAMAQAHARSRSPAAAAAVALDKLARNLTLWIALQLGGLCLGACAVDSPKSLLPGDVVSTTKLSTVRAHIESRGETLIDGDDLFRVSDAFGANDELIVRFPLVDQPVESGLLRGDYSEYAGGLFPLVVISATGEEKTVAMLELRLDADVFPRQGLTVSEPDSTDNGDLGNAARKNLALTAACSHGDRSNSCLPSMVKACFSSCPDGCWERGRARRKICIYGTWYWTQEWAGCASCANIWMYCCPA